MIRPLLLVLCLFLISPNASAAGRKLLVLSVDGLDHRYLRDADKLGLKIPNMRRLMREGAWANGVIGVVPTVTWPSHTSIITGVPPLVHGILGNRRPKEEGGDYYWDASLLKVPTLLHAVRKAGRKSAAITWPVTVNAPIDFNLPEYFVKRNGGGMDLHSIEQKGTPGLVGEIAVSYPSFTQEWMDDRTRALATKFFLRVKQPDLILVHFVDLDAEAHDNGPFTREANAKVEYTDELIGDILGVMPPDYALALVSDHGFERTDTAVNLARVLADHARDVAISTYLLVARSQAAVSAIQKLRTDAAYGIGPSVPIENLKKLAPESAENALAAWEPAPHFTFAAGLPGESTESEIFRKINRRGNHGYWPLRQDYRSVYLLWHKGIKAQRLPEMPMTGIAERFAAILELPYPFTHTAAPVR